MAFGRVFAILSGVAFAACAGVLAAVRARWSTPNAPVGVEDLSALGVATVAAMAALMVAVHRQPAVPAELRAGTLGRALLDGMLTAASALLGAWVQIVQPLGLRTGVDLISYVRSEKRRVGKDCRTRWVVHHTKNNAR